jgi:hypothetical protein
MQTSTGIKSPETPAAIAFAIGRSPAVTLAMSAPEAFGTRSSPKATVPPRSAFAPPPGSATSIGSSAAPGSFWQIPTDLSVAAAVMATC